MAKRKPSDHDCRDHIVIARGHIGRNDGPNGGKVRFRCGVCKAPVTLVMKPNEVLARVQA